MARLFFALWPEPAVRDALAAAAAALACDGGQRVPDANLHLTLAFLGEVDAATCAALCAETRIGGVVPFVLDIDGAGWWRASGTVWLAPRAVPADLGRLEAALRERLQGQGVVLETRPFAPHVTVARKLRTAPAPYSGDAVRWPVYDYVLARSQTDPGGARYTVLQRWRLAPHAA